MSDTAAPAPAPGPAPQLGKPAGGRLAFVRTKWGQRGLAAAALLFALILPQLFDSGDPWIEDFTLVLAYMIMALGLNVVVGFAGLLDLGYVAFYALGSYTVGWFASGHFNKADVHIGASEFAANLPGIHINFLLIIPIAALIAAAAGRDHRLPDPAPARRLHRHRDAGLRRDHRPRRDQRRRGRLRHRLLQPDQRQDRHPAGGPARPAVPGPVHHARSETVVLPGARARAAGHLHQPAPARLAAGPVLDRGARGRGRRRLHGHPDRQGQAARLRDRRRHGRRLRRLPRSLHRGHQRRLVPVLVLHLHPGDDHPRRARLDLGRDPRRRHAVADQHAPDPGRAQPGGPGRPELRPHPVELRHLRLPAGDHDGAAAAGPAARAAP